MNVLTMKFPAGRYALLSLAAFLFSAGVPVSFSGEKTAPPGSPVPESIDLNGTWLMKDFTIGVGLTRDVNQPGKVPAANLANPISDLRRHSGKAISLATWDAPRLRFLCRETA